VALAAEEVILAVIPGRRAATNYDVQLHIARISRFPDAQLRI
jgi:hypothetical protein